MPMSFGILGKAIALFMVVAFALWLIFTYVFVSDEDAAIESERLGTVETPSP
jgi:regulator of protease activity HflC (stomatin/prohibitin superfamily)